MPTHTTNAPKLPRSKEDYVQAIADFTKAVGLDPTKSTKVQAILRSPQYASGYNTRGLAHYNNQGYDLAISAYDQAIKLDPNNAIYHDNRGMRTTARRITITRLMTTIRR